MSIILPSFVGIAMPSGAGASGFTITIRDTESNIFARSGDAVGTIAFGTDTNDLYIFDGTNFQIYENT
tara:strand:- start:348 stop:551 length:204 start_codon:yes stop_codon:yes gene_type:complete